MVTCNRLMNPFSINPKKLHGTNGAGTCLQRTKHPTKLPNDHPAKSQQSAPATATPLKNQGANRITRLGSPRASGSTKKQKNGVWVHFAGPLGPPP